MADREAPILDDGAPGLRTNHGPLGGADNIARWRARFPQEAVDRFRRRAAWSANRRRKAWPKFARACCKMAGPRSFSSTPGGRVLVATQRDGRFQLVLLRDPAACHRRCTGAGDLTWASVDRDRRGMAAEQLYVWSTRYHTYEQW